MARQYFGPVPQTPGEPTRSATRSSPVKWSDATEPARIRAIVTAVVQLCAALGITLGFDLPGIAEAAIILAAAVLPLIQGEATRAVVSPAKHVVIPQTPGRPDHAA